MKLLVLNYIFIGSMATAVQHLGDPTVARQMKQNGYIDLDIHRKLAGCEDDFECPQNSERKPGRTCYDSFDDCECNLGYSKEGNRCVAKEGLCNMDYVAMVEQKQADVEFWLDKAKGGETPEEQIGYFEKMNDVLSDAWNDYNKGKASCDMYVFDDDDGERRKLRCCSRLRDGFKKLANGFKTVVKAVVDSVVDVFVELVECGVGVVTDGVKCGLIGCAFGLFGVAADIAFTLATGGVNKAFATFCDVTEAFVEDDGCNTQQCKDKRSRKAKLDILKGAAGAVCAINEKIESPILGEVCKFEDQVDEITDATADLLDANEVVSRFLEVFVTAMCGNPGSALTDILEEVVSCEIGCAKSNNVFCSANDKDVGGGGGGIDYEQHEGKACRTSNGGNGAEGSEYDSQKNKSEEFCESECSNRSSCKAWEFSHGSGRCEIWTQKPGEFQNKSGIDCNVKLV